MKHFSRTALSSSILITIILVLVVSLRGRQDATADEILNRVEKVYADCKTYSDSGTTKFVLFSLTGNVTSEGRFTTAFVEPDRLKFDFQEIIDGQQARTILWRRGNDFSTWSTITGQIKQKRNLLSALSETGVYTSQSAYNIPSLLFQQEQELKGRLLTTMWGIERADDAELDGNDCFRITGKKGRSRESSILTLWIDKTDYLIHRIDWNQPGAERTIVYKPVINEEVKEDALKFDPPHQ